LYLIGVSSFLQVELVPELLEEHGQGAVLFRCLLEKKKTVFVWMEKLIIKLKAFQIAITNKFISKMRLNVYFKNKQ
jgi:hypothetical protein